MSGEKKGKNTEKINKGQLKDTSYDLAPHILLFGFLGVLGPGFVSQRTECASGFIFYIFVFAKGFVCTQEAFFFSVFFFKDTLSHLW